MKEYSYSGYGFDLRGLTLLVIAGAWLVGILLSSWILLPALVLLIGAGAALLCLIPCWRDTRSRLIILIILWLLLGAWRYAIASPIGDPQAISSFIGQKVTVRGSVADEPTLAGRSRIMQVAVSSMSRDGGSSWQDAHGQLEVQMLGTTLDTPYGPNYGDSVELQGKLQPAPPYSPPGVFAGMAFPRVTVSASGGNPILAALFHLRLTLAISIEQALPQPGAALLIAILLSLHTPALGLFTSSFQETGTAHLISPSGFKVTILAGFLMASTRWLYEKSDKQRGFLPAQRSRDEWRRWLASGIVLAGIFVYTILSGAGPAAIRAGIMGSLLVLAPCIGRTYNVYTALAAAALLMSLWNPFVLWDAGFQLSFLGTIGIVLFEPSFQRRLSPLKRWPGGRVICENLAVTLSAELSTLPIIALDFHLISFVAPLTNLLTVPLLGVLISLGLAICGTDLLMAPLGALSGWAVQPLLGYMERIVPWSANLPGAYHPVQNMNSGIAWTYYGLLALLASLYFSRQSARSQSPPAPAVQPVQPLLPMLPSLSRRTWFVLQCGAALVVALAMGSTTSAAQSNGHLILTFLPVGIPGQVVRGTQEQIEQGQAILIRTADGKTVLLDGGPDATSLAQELDGQLPFWQRSLDAVILTSPRTDHLTGLQDVITRYQIGEVLDAGMLHPNTGYALWRHTINQRGLRYIQLRQGTTVPIGTTAALQVLWPPSPLHKSSSEELDNALVIRLVTPEGRVLFLGAAALSKFALSGLLSTVDASYLQADIVQVMGESGKAFPSQFATLLQETHLSRLVITPAALTPRQRKAGATSLMTALPVGVDPQAIMQTAQVGALECNSNGNCWNEDATTT